MEFNNIYLDFDGVLVDSEKRVVQYKEKQPNLSWDDFFEKLNWYSLLEESLEINDSLKIVYELQKNHKNIAILTKIHTLLEMQAKVNFLREKNRITLPIFFVPPHVNKSQIIVPNRDDLLIDDSKKNIDDWISSGGIGMCFCENLSNNEKGKVKSLKFLL